MAGRGSTKKVWQALGRESLLALRPDLAASAYSRASDSRMLHACACLAQRKAQGLQDAHLHAYAFALLVSTAPAKRATASSPVHVRLSWRERISLSRGAKVIGSD